MPEYTPQEAEMNRQMDREMKEYWELWDEMTEIEQEKKVKKRGKDRRD